MNSNKKSIQSNARKQDAFDQQFSKPMANRDSQHMDELYFRTSQNQSGSKPAIRSR